MDLIATPSKTTRSREAPLHPSRLKSIEMSSKSSKPPTPELKSPAKSFHAILSQHPSGSAFHRMSSLGPTKPGASIARPSERGSTLRAPTINLCNTPELTKQQKEELCTAFGMFDPRGRGVIDSRGLTCALRAMGFEPTHAEIEKIVMSVQGKVSKTIDFKYFFNLMESKMLQDFTKIETEKAFDLFGDKNAGRITFENLKAIAQELGEVVDDEEIKEMINFADQEKKGFVEFKDFKAILQRPRQA